MDVFSLALSALWMCFQRSFSWTVVSKTVLFLRLAQGRFGECYVVTFTGQRLSLVRPSVPCAKLAEIDGDARKIYCD